MKKLLVLYFCMPLIVIFNAFVFEMVFDEEALSTFDASSLYIFRLAFVLLALSSMVLTYTYFKMHPLLQILFLNFSALFVILDYYLNLGNAGSDNLLFLLPMIIVVYLSRYKAIKTFNEENQ